MRKAASKEAHFFLSGPLTRTPLRRRAGRCRIENYWIGRENPIKQQRLKTRDQLTPQSHTAVKDL
jgi:hypothetical protein